ncbi:B-box zinc finger protein [Egicoccus sp. AB-alg2]|uniref:B-box zinc finger protein n=1 Tax=Egicoccus sp. AB-alg2 TaxID=3242693 RepID=UPI00359D6B6C
MDAPTCPRHPDVETRLSCSACETPICPSCGVEAAVGYKCPDCARQDGASTPRPRSRSRARGAVAAPAPGERLPTTTAVKATAIGLAAAALGGLLLGPILIGGAFFLISAGVIGWGVARAVYWATDEVSTPYVRAIALTAAGFSVAIGMATAAGPTTVRELAFLAYPAAMYGGWIVVRQR